MISMSLGALTWVACIVTMWPLRVGVVPTLLGVLALAAALLAGLRAWRNASERRDDSMELIRATDRISRRYRSATTGTA